jgi:hypothetical protein
MAFRCAKNGDGMNVLYDAIVPNKRAVDAEIGWLLRPLLKRQAASVQTSC